MTEPVARRVIVVGAGLGGVRTAEALRREGFAGSITVIGAEHRPPYDRPPLTKTVIRGTQDDTSFPTDFAAMGIDIVLGSRAVGVEVATKCVRLDDGTALGFDSLVLAPGAAPRWLPGTSGMRGVHVVRTLDDALDLRDALTRTSRAVVVGGGFVGCEIAASARTIGAQVDLIEALPAPLIRVLGADGAALVKETLLKRGVRVHTGAGVDKLLSDSGGTVTGVRLADGSTLATSVLVLGLGVSPQLDWLAGSGIELADGIVCDTGGRTSCADIWAVGDAAAWPDPRTGHPTRVEHWTSVIDQASTVARGIAASGSPTPATMPYFWSDIFDLRIQAIGFIDPAHEVRRIDVGGRTVLLYSEDGTLTGAVGFSAARAISRIRPALIAGTPTREAVEFLRDGL